MSQIVFNLIIFNGVLIIFLVEYLESIVLYYILHDRGLGILKLRDAINKKIIVYSLNPFFS